MTPRRKPGTVPGTKFTDDHRKRLSEAHKNSPIAKRHRRRLAVSLEGKSPTPLAIARSLASRRVKRMKLTPKDSPELYEHYTQMYLKQRASRGKS